MATDVLHVGDVRAVLPTLPSGSVQTCVTSPPYWQLRDYGCDGQLGLEETPAEFVANLVGVMREVRRVLADDGTLWLNIGDKYSTDGKWGGSTGGKHAKALHGANGPSRRKVFSGLPSKNLLGLPWRVAFALQDDGWFLRSDIIWHKPNAMPESVTDRPRSSHEYLFLLSKSARYHYDADAIRQPLAPKTLTTFGTVRAATDRDVMGSDRAAAWASDVPSRRPRVDDDGNPVGGNVPSVWSIAVAPAIKGHEASFPPALARGCILAGSPVGGVVLDPFAGTGTTWLEASRLGRRFVGIELNPSYAAMARMRVADDAPLFAVTGAPPSGEEVGGGD